MPWFIDAIIHIILKPDVFENTERVTNNLVIKRYQKWTFYRKLRVLNSQSTSLEYKIYSLKNKIF